MTNISKCRLHRMLPFVQNYLSGFKTKSQFCPSIPPPPHPERNVRSDSKSNHSVKTTFFSFYNLFILYICVEISQNIPHSTPPLHQSSFITRIILLQKSVLHGPVTLVIASPSPSWATGWRDVCVCVRERERGGRERERQKVLEKLSFNLTKLLYHLISLFCVYFPFLFFQSSWYLRVHTMIKHSVYGIYLYMQSLNAPY